MHRRFPRRQIKRPIGILYKGKYEVGSVKEISEGGLLISTDFEIEEGHKFIATLRTFEKDWVSTSMLTCYTQEKGTYGAQFVDLPFQSRRQIRNLVASMSKKDSE